MIKHFPCLWCKPLKRHTDLNSFAQRANDTNTDFSCIYKGIRHQQESKHHKSISRQCFHTPLCDCSAALSRNISHILPNGSHPYGNNQRFSCTHTHIRTHNLTRTLTTSALQHSADQAAEINPDPLRPSAVTVSATSGRRDIIFAEQHVTFCTNLPLVLALGSRAVM